MKRLFMFLDAALAVVSSDSKIVKLPSHPSPVNYKHMSMNIVARGRGKKHCGTADVCGIAPMSSRNALQNLTIADLIAPQGRGVVRIYITRCNGVHIDPMSCPLIGKRLGKLRHRSL